MYIRYYHTLNTPYTLGNWVQSSPDLTGPGLGRLAIGPKLWIRTQS